MCIDLEENAERLKSDNRLAIKTEQEENHPATRCDNKNDGKRGGYLEGIFDDKSTEISLRDQRKGKDNPTMKRLVKL
jgi:hypothetical protein